MLRDALRTTGANLGAVVQGVEAHVQGVCGRTVQHATAEHVAALQAAGNASTPAANAEQAAQGEHPRAHFALHTAQWEPQLLAALQAGAERAAAERAAAASSTQGSQDHEYVYVPVSDSD